MTQAEAEWQLAECRRKIDEIDRQLRDLLNKRTEIVVDVLRMKDELTMPVYEANREEAVLRNVTEGNQGPLDNAMLKRLFETLMAEMRTFQQQRRAQATGSDAADSKDSGR
jgi:chorismate mutase